MKPDTKEEKGPNQSGVVRDSKSTKPFLFAIEDIVAAHFGIQIKRSKELVAGITEEKTYNR